MSLKGKELTDKRIQCNQEILRKLSEYLSKYPDMRFSQALLNLNIVSDAYHHCDSYWADEFYIEPEEVLKRMKG